MSCPSTLRTYTSAIASKEYQIGQLTDNDVVFLDHQGFLDEPSLRIFDEAEQSLAHALDTALDRSVVLSPEQLRVLSKLGNTVLRQEDGYMNAAVIGKAIQNRASVRALSDANESDWINLFIKDVWDFFEMTTTFTFTQDYPWRRYDEAIMQILPARASLVSPKPNFAFGLKVEPQLNFWKRLRQWKDKSVPLVDLFATLDMATPFLIFESESSGGTVRMAEDQLANLLVKAHDILCSLTLEKELYILGIVQVQFILYFYMSFSTRQVDQDGKTFTDTIYIVKLDKGFFDDLQGSLKCLKFIEWAKNYGLSVYKDTVESALNRP